MHDRMLEMIQIDYVIIQSDIKVLGPERASNQIKVHKTLSAKRKICVAE